MGDASCTKNTLISCGAVRKVKLKVKEGKSYLWNWGPGFQISSVLLAPKEPEISDLSSLTLFPHLSYGDNKAPSRAVVSRNCQCSIGVSFPSVPAACYAGDLGGNLALHSQQEAPI